MKRLFFDAVIVIWPFKIKPSWPILSSFAPKELKLVFEPSRGTILRFDWTCPPLPRGRRIVNPLLPFAVNLTTVVWVDLCPAVSTWREKILCLTDSLNQKNQSKCQLLSVSRLLLFVDLDKAHYRRHHFHLSRYEKIYNLCYVTSSVTLKEKVLAAFPILV